MVDCDNGFSCWILGRGAGIVETPIWKTLIVAVARRSEPLFQHWSNNLIDSVLAQFVSQEGLNYCCNVDRNTVIHSNLEPVVWLKGLDH